MRLTPHQFMALSQAEKANIKKTIFIPPKSGSGHFGLIEITLKRPIYPSVH